VFLKAAAIQPTYPLQKSCFNSLQLTGKHIVIAKVVTLYPIAMPSFFIRLGLICLLAFPLPCLSQQGGKKLTSFKLPSSNRSGLIDIFIAYKPVFGIDQFQDVAAVKLNLNVELSRATDIKGNFWYRYWYEGEQYTDLQLGKDVFVPIDLDAMHLKVWITGPNAFMQTISWNKHMGNQIIVRVPGKHKASEFQAFVQELESVSFKGDQAIKQAIIDLRTAQRKKTEDEQKKQAEKLAAENLKKEKPELRNSEVKPPIATKPVNINASTNGSAKSIDDDFWTEKKSTPATNINNNSTANLPELAMSTDGKYYRKDAGGKYQQIGYDEYQLLKREKAQEKKQVTQMDATAKREADQKVLDQTMSRIKQDQAASDAMWKDIDRKIELRSQAYTAVRGREEARENLNEVSKLSGGYSSVQELMADFNQRMSQVNSAVSDLTAKKNSAWNSSVDASFNGPNDGAYADGLKAIGGLVNSLKEDKERKRAQEELRAQKEAMVREMEAEEKRLLTGIRTDIFKRFKEGSTPLSTSKLGAQTIYFFVYAYDPSQLGLKSATLYLSGVFPVQRYSDGTWPFKNSIVNDIAKLTPYGEVLHGYYTNGEEARAMQKALNDVFAQTGGSTVAISYKGKKSASASTAGKGDFWETGKNASPVTTSKNTSPEKKDDFWNN
jgi:hypothetical protein